MTSASKRSKRKERKAATRAALLPLAVRAVNAAYDEALLYGLDQGSPWVTGRMIMGMIPGPGESVGQGFTDRQVTAALGHLVETGIFARRQEGTGQAYYRRLAALEQLAAQAE